MLRPAEIPEYIHSPNDIWKQDNEKYRFSDEDIANILDILAQYYHGPDVILTFTLDWEWFQDIVHYKQELQDESNILTEFEKGKATKTQASFSDDDNHQNAYLSLLLLSGLEGFRELLERMSDISFYIYLQKNYHADEYSSQHHRKYYQHLQEMVQELNTILGKYWLQLKEYELGEIRVVNEK